MDIISQISISEAILLFNLIFVLPALAYLVLRLRKYEKLYGVLQEDRSKKKKKKKDEEAPPPPPAASKANLDVYPYKGKAFMTTAEKACLDALAEAMGSEVLVFPKVALWETMESTDPEPAYRERLNGRTYDFLVCDKRTGQALTGVMFRPVKPRAIAASEEMKKICAAAGANLVFIEQAEQYDAASLKSELGIPDLDI